MTVMIHLIAASGLVANKTTNLAKTQNSQTPSSSVSEYACGGNGKVDSNDRVYEQANIFSVLRLGLRGAALPFSKRAHENVSFRVIQIPGMRNRARRQ